MKCPVCGGLQDKVIGSIVINSGNVVRRRRGCMNCNTRYITYETLAYTLKGGTGGGPLDRYKVTINIERGAT